MGMKGTCRSCNRGGCPLLSAPIYSRTPSRHPLLSSVLSLFCQPSGQRTSEIGQKGQKLEFIWCALVFSREIGRPEEAKSKHIFGMWCKVVQDARAWLPAFGLSLVQVCRVSGLFPAFVACSLPFVRFPALPLSGCLQIWLYFAFLGGFQRVLGLLRGFVLLWRFAWLVGLLCA